MESPLESYYDTLLTNGHTQLWQEVAERSLAQLEESDELVQLLGRMGVPLSRQRDRVWLRWHLAPEWLDHPDLPEAMRLLREEIGDEWDQIRKPTGRTSATLGMSF